MAIQRLTVAYRSRSRPSSTLGAKASTVCPYYLDGDLAQRDPIAPCEAPEVLQGPVIPVFSRRLSMAADVASVQFSRTVERRITPAGPASDGHAALWTLPRGPADAGLSKLNSMLGSFFGPALGALEVVRERVLRGHPARFGRHARPDPL
jgi:hypothetical protein